MSDTFRQTAGRTVWRRSSPTFPRRVLRCAARRPRSTAGTWTIRTAYFRAAAARAAGYRGDPAGERARRFQKPDRLGPDDEWIPVLTLPDSAPGGPRVAASVIRYGGDMKGCLAVCGAIGRNASVPIDEETQARYLVRSLAISLALDVNGYYWYEFRSPEVIPDYTEHHFGITHSNFAPKAAFGAYMNFIKLRPEGSIQRAVPLHDDATGLYRCEWTRPDGTPAGVLWKPGATEKRELEFAGGDAPSIRFRDYTGRTMKPVRTADGSYIVPLGESPVFFEGGVLNLNPIAKTSMR